MIVGADNPQCLGRKERRNMPIQFDNARPATKIKVSC